MDLLATLDCFVVVRFKDISLRDIPGENLLSPSPKREPTPSPCLRSQKVEILKRRKGLLSSTFRDVAFEQTDFEV